MWFLTYTQGWFYGSTGSKILFYIIMMMTPSFFLKLVPKTDKEVSLVLPF
jgi:hypothetical protein